MAKMNPYLKAASKLRTVDSNAGEEFNPMSFGRQGRSGNRKVSSNERMFDNKGEINASDNAEVLDKIKGLLDGASDGTFDVQQVAVHSKHASLKVDAADKDALVQMAMSDPTSEGFARCGQALLNPIKEVIDFEGMTRKVWYPRDVKPGEVVRYDKDPYVVGWQIAEDGQTPESQVEGKYIYPPEFEVSTFPLLELKDISRAQFNILERTQDRARQAIEYQEDLAGLTLLQNAGTTENDITYFATCNISALESIRYQVERHRLILDKFIVHRQEISDFVTTISQQVDPVTQRELIMGGFVGIILNAMVITTAGTNNRFQLLNPGEVIGVTQPEYLGGFGVRQELISEPVTQFNEGKPRRGWYYYELCFLGLGHSAGVALGQKTS